MDLIDKHERIQVLKELREASGCEFGIAKQWVSHKTFNLPEPTPCPHCGQPLRTARAKQCVFVGVTGTRLVVRTSPVTG